MTGTIAGVILAGGRSSRMGGGDKCLRLIGGIPMLERIITRMRPQVQDLALNANGDPGRFAGYGLPVIGDTIAGHAGPLAGVLAGLEWAAAQFGHTHIVTVSSDAPLVPLDLVQRLVEANDGSESRMVLAATINGLQPVIGLWPVTLAPALEQYLSAANAKVMDFVADHDLKSVEFPLIEREGLNADPFFNVNTPEDLAQAERLAAILP